MAYCMGQMRDLSHKFPSNDTKFVWTETNIHYATLNAAVRRGLLEKVGTAYHFLPKGRAFAAMEQAFLLKDREYISFRNKGAALGMLCSIKGLDIRDCWDKPWDYDGNVEIISEDNEWEDLITDATN